MYASVASFLAQIWHKFSVKTIDWPTPFMALAIALTTYLQFFTVTTTIYLRLLMFLIVLLIFLKTKIQFLHGLKTQSFSIVWLMSFLGFIIWIAENISTYFGAWAYSYQAQGWHPVDAGKIVSWSLLSSVNIILFISFSAKIAEFKPRK